MRLCERLITFQSHAGSIEVRKLSCAPNISSGSFNPTLVRLRSLKFVPMLKELGLVSIPRWFD